MPLAPVTATSSLWGAPVCMVDPPAVVILSRLSGGSGQSVDLQRQGRGRGLAPGYQIAEKLFQGELFFHPEIVLDRLGNGATRLLVDAKQHGEDIADTAFYPALLRIWLGERPADSDLREALLKKPQ